MTPERKKLIERYQRWLDTNPAKGIIAAQCATIAQEHAKTVLEEAADKIEGNKINMPMLNDLERSYNDAIKDAKDIIISLLIPKEEP